MRTHDFTIGFKTVAVMIVAVTAVFLPQGCRKQERQAPAISVPREDVHRYYVCKSLSRRDETIFVPVDNEKLVAKMQPLLSREEILRLIQDRKSVV